MSPKKLRNMDQEEVKNLDDDDFRTRLMYDLESMAWWFRIGTITLAMLQTGIFLLLGVILRGA